MKRRTEKDLDRWLALFVCSELLQEESSRSVVKSADECGVSKRDHLPRSRCIARCGSALVYDGLSQLYSIPGQYFLAPTQFTAEEALAVGSCAMIGGTFRITLPERGQQSRRQN